MVRTGYWFTVLIVVLGQVWGQGGGYYEVEDLLLGTSMHNSRDADWQPDKDGIALEVTGLAMMEDGRLAVAIRKGEIWMLHGALGPVDAIVYERFASGLDEPLGLLYQSDRLLVAQRSEVTALVDSDEDGVADQYLTVGKGWAVNGNYHGYAYGPVQDSAGRLWATLNLEMGSQADNARPWRGWGVVLGEDGRVQPMCAGMRSPCGLGRNAMGDVFFTDQQGNWIPTNSLHHLRPGAYYGNPDGISAEALAGSPLKPLAAEVNGDPYPVALKKLPQLVPPAVWFPYIKMGRSRTGFVLDDTAGAFGPYVNQLFVGEFTDSKIGRVFLEKVRGEYQGACFPFLEGFPCAVYQLAFGGKGTLFVGMTNRGWSSLGSAAYGLQRLRWTGKMPFEVSEMRARPDGFELVFTRPVNPEDAGRTDAYHMHAYTYPLHQRYGGDEILTDTVPIREARVSEDGSRVRLFCEGLRPYFVHELHYDGVRSAHGERPWHTRAYYTLNQLPELSPRAEP